MISIRAHGKEWAALDCNASDMEVWLRYEGVIAQTPSALPLTPARRSHARRRPPRARIHRRFCTSADASSAGAVDAADTAADETLPRAEHVDLTKSSTHRRLHRLWRAGRLLLRGPRLSELATQGKLERVRRGSSASDAVAATEARIAERAFRRELLAYCRR